jgi:hypothetical protein
MGFLGAKASTDGALKGLEFFDYLQTELTQLLDFKSGIADKWQTAHEWLLRAGRVKN